jgi:hypothetical protein
MAINLLVQDYNAKKSNFTKKRGLESYAFTRIQHREENIAEDLNIGYNSYSTNKREEGGGK